MVYLAHSLQSYFKAADVNLYSTAPVYIPRLELYVLFTCDEAKGRNTISLSEEFFDRKGCDVDVRVHILYRDVGQQPEDADIIWEYTAFTKIFDQCVRELGRTTEAASRVLEVCQEKKILAGYLKEREEEVKRTMLAIFEQEEAEAIDRRNFRKEVTAENKEEMKKCMIRMAKAGELSVNNLSVFFPQLSPSDIEEIKREVKPQE